MSSSIIKYVVIPAGQTHVFKKSDTVVSVMNSGGVNFTNTCTLPAAEATVDYIITWTSHVNNANGKQDAWEDKNDHPTIESIHLGDATYPINVPIWDPGSVVIKILAIPQLSAVLIDLVAVNINTGNSGVLYQCGINFKTTPAIAASLYAVPLVYGMTATRIYAIPNPF